MDWDGAVVAFEVVFFVMSRDGYDGVWIVGLRYDASLQSDLIILCLVRNIALSQIVLMAG
jgi:hypothetical protein